MTGMDSPSFTLLKSLRPMTIFGNVPAVVEEEERQCAADKTSVGEIKEPPQ